MFRQFFSGIWQKMQSRFFIITTIFVCFSMILLSRIFYLQIIKGSQYQESFTLKIQKTQSIDSTRGCIYDRNGNLLAYNELTYSVTIEDNGAFDDLSNNGKNDALNANILNLLEILEEKGETIKQHFHIHVDDDGEYAFDMGEGTSRNRFIADVYGARSFRDLKEEQQTSTADDLMKYLCDKRYHLDRVTMSKEDILRIVNIRYAMSQVTYSKFLVTTVAENVSQETVSYVKENTDTLIGVDITKDYQRYYNDAIYFSSVIGYTGVISSDEYDQLSADDDEYALNDIVGKAGIEQFMDKTLRGTKGHKKFYVDSLGNVLQTVSETPPVPGGNLYLTLDRDTQISTYKILEQELAGIVLLKMEDIMTYDAHEATSTYDIRIPVGDVYIALIDNSTLNIGDFAYADSESVQASVYSRFIPRQQEAVNGVLDEIRNPSGRYVDLSDEYQEYCHYIGSDYLRYQTGIIDPDALDVTDDTYKAWNNGAISLREYLNHAVSKGWINTSKLDTLMEQESKYAEAEEVVNAILDYLEDVLYEDEDFSKIIYKYMILDETISGREICLMLYEQDAIPHDEDLKAMLRDGGISPFDFLYAQISNLNITPAQLALEPCTASCVVTDPDTGGVLACVSYPGYDNNRLSNNMDSDYYNKLIKDKSNPLYNYATQQRTAPGSTFKMVTASAGLEEDIIDPYTEFVCQGIYTEVDPPPKCWAYPYTHDSLDVEHAIQVSCNIFFFNVGYRLGLKENGKYSSSLGIDKLTKYAQKFGLGEKSGIELQESDPNISGTDSVRSAIGQGENIYTTAQMARYVTSIANSGTVYDLTLLDHLTDSNGKILEDYRTDVYGELGFKESTIDAIRSGMQRMTSTSSQFETINSMGFSTGGKTGTSEESSLHPDHVLFVGFAPFDDPEIAYAVRIAHGYTSGYAAEIAADIVKYHFNLVNRDSIVDGVANSVAAAAHSD